MRFHTACDFNLFHLTECVAYNHVLRFNITATYYQAFPLIYGLNHSDMMEVCWSYVYELPKIDQSPGYF